MKYVSIFSVTLKSAITPSFIGLIATTFPGVRPSISLASRPTATTSPLFLLIATIDGSLTTIPFVRAKTSVSAVPRSIAKSDERRLKIDLMLKPFLFTTAFPPEFCDSALPKRWDACAVPANSFSALLRNDDFHALNCRAPAPILAGDYNLMTSSSHRRREVTEAPIGLNVHNLSPIDDQGRAWLGAPYYFNHIAVQLSAVDLQQHLLLFALRHQRELIRITRFTGRVTRVDRGHAPEVVAGIKPCDFNARLASPSCRYDMTEHRCVADLHVVELRHCRRFPREMNRIMLWIGHDDRLQIQRSDKFRGCEN